MGNSKICIYCYVTADILGKSNTDMTNGIQRKIKVNGRKLGIVIVFKYFGAIVF